MKIIGGIAGGQNIFAPKNIRPTRGMVREALFSIIEIENKTFLDLYAGSGAVGIEALSRGAASVYFIERSWNICRYIERNLKKTGLAGKVINNSVETALKNLGCKIDFIFMDPPYGKGLIEKTLLKLNSLMHEETIIIIEYPTKDKPSHNGFKEIKNKKYGDSSLLLLKK